MNLQPKLLGKLKFAVEAKTSTLVFIAMGLEHDDAAFFRKASRKQEP